MKEMRLAGIDSMEAANHFLETRFCSRVGAAFYGGTAECPQCPSTTGAGTAPGRNLECTRGPQSGSGPHRKLGRESLGSTAGRSMCRASWSCGRHRTALGRKLLVALPRAISAPARLPRTGAASRSPFRPTASRTCGTNTETQKPKQTQIPCACRAPLEKTMEADISIWRKTWTFLLCVDTRHNLRPTTKHAMWYNIQLRSKEENAASHRSQRRFAKE